MTALGTRFRSERHGPGEFTPKRVQDLNDAAEAGHPIAVAFVLLDLLWRDTEPGRQFLMAQPSRDPSLDERGWKFRG